ncbi:2-acylglycerol O-acyltransferase 1 (Acyl-CoA:monoacylglycerol acyltransferase 1) (MGAT1) (Monoacylglycerol O-acyltransferase 1) [Durusdinium trenchii]|uniref:2-acylglycerol O-acyltransferase 1 (Acyl-CoA:monoacylglycerol acyltransferase 1) (MGAT1) (Monoacylglycerol O-acyltransferase 1) n=1 Tax=Durusdinium trenchii TaxID=1381693 RepID=A0ABP0KBF5_9DINO
MYSLLGREVAAKIALFPDQVEVFREPHGLNDTALSRNFAFIGAASHTVVFGFGLACATLLQKARVLQGLRHKTQPLTMVSSLALVLLIAAIFHGLSWRFLNFCFEEEIYMVHDFAQLFFDAKAGASPFAWSSSVSYTVALVLGLLMNIEMIPFTADMSAFQSLSVWTTFTGVPFIAWLVTLDIVTMPILNSAVGSEVQDETRNATKSIAFIIGLVICCLVPTTMTFLNTLAKLEFVSPETGKTLGFTAFLVHNFAESLRTLLISSVFASFFLVASLHDEDFSLPEMVLFTVESVFAVALRLHVYVGFGVVAFVGYCGYVFNKDIWPTSLLERPVDMLVASPYHKWVLNVVSFVLVSYLWNCHLIGFWGSFGPFHIFAAFHPRYTQVEAHKDAWIWVLFGTYGFAVVLKSAMKIFSARFKVKWGFMQDLVMAFFMVVPLGMILWYNFINSRPGFPIYIGMTVIHLFYISRTWKDRPESTGWRFWPALRLSRLWTLIELYFDQHIIVDGCNVNTKDPACKGNTANWSPNHSDLDYDKIKVDGQEPTPRLMGFHPHGLLPVAVVWSHMTPRWRSIFGLQMPVTLTDAFIHAIPFFRDFAQFAGGLEVTRDNVISVLRQRKTALLVPGGQGEILLHSSENLAKKWAVCDAKHKGFIRVALENGAELVPTYSFGELQAIQNISFPPMQRFTRKVLGFSFPFFPVGLLGILPIPNPVQMTWVIGKPMRFPCATPGKPTNAEVDFAHEKYFEALVALYDKYKADAGFPDWTIKLSK